MSKDELPCPQLACHDNSVMFITVSLAPGTKPQYAENNKYVK